MIIGGAPRSTVFIVFFNDTATTEIYTLSLHDALPIFLQDPNKKTDVFVRFSTVIGSKGSADTARDPRGFAVKLDRKSTRLNSSHANISYAVFCLKKKNSRAFNLYRHRLRKSMNSSHAN